MLDDKAKSMLQIIKINEHYLFTLREGDRSVNLEVEEIVFIYTKLLFIHKFRNKKRNLLCIGRFDSYLIKLQLIPSSHVSHDDAITLSVSAPNSNVVNRQMFTFNAKQNYHLMHQIRIAISVSLVMDTPYEFELHKLLVRATIDLMASRIMKEQSKEKNNPTLSVASLLNRELGYRITGRRFVGPQFSRKGNAISTKIISFRNKLSEEPLFRNVEEALANRNIPRSRKIAIAHAIEDSGDLKNKLRNVFSFLNLESWFNENVEGSELGFICDCIKFKLEGPHLLFGYKEAYSFIKSYLFEGALPKRWKNLKQIEVKNILK